MQQTTTSLTNYLQPLRTYKKLVVAIAVGITLAGTVVGFLAPTNYRASASILVAPVADLDVVDPEWVDVATELRIAKSRAVVDQVADRLASEGIQVDNDALGDNVAVTNPEDTRILDISYTSSSADDSAKIANTFAEIYVQYRASLANETIDERQRDLAAKIDVLNSQLIEITAERAAAPEGSNLATDLNIQQRTVEADLAALQASLTRLSTIGVSGSEVVDAAQIPNSPEGLGSLQIIFGALLGGLAFGTIGAFAMDAFAKRDKAALEAAANIGRRGRRASDHVAPLESQRTAERQTPALGSGATEIVVATPPEPSDTMAQRDAIETDSTDEFGHRVDETPHADSPEQGASFSAESNYDDLLDELAQLGTKGSVVVLCVSGDGHPETSVAAGFSLAAELNNMGASILVVDTVLHDPVVGPIAGMPESPGLAEVLTGVVPFNKAVRPIPVFEEISVLTVGTSSKETYAALNDGLAEVLSTARDQFNVTVIIGGTVNDARVSAAVSLLADGLVIAAPVAVGQSLPAELYEDVRQLPVRTLAVISAGQIGQLLERSLDNETQASPSH